MSDQAIKRISVVGAGLMGHGIAQEFALAGYRVTMHARTQASLTRAEENIQANLARLVALGALTEDQARPVLSHIRAELDLEGAVEDADLVIESVFEEAELKRRIFEQLDRLCPPHTILASNTSTLMPSQFMHTVQRGDKVLVAHYANPPYLIPIVEMVRGPATSDETLDTLSGLLTRVGKRPVVVQKEVPGFILNRLQGALLREALSMVQNGIASPQDIDTAMKNSIGRRWAVAGIFEVFELAGWDLISAAMQGLYPHLTTSQKIPPVLSAKVVQDELGVKTGKGFYDWTPESADALRQRIAHALVETERWTQQAGQQDRAKPH